MALDVSELFVSEWGDIQLFISRLEWEAGETQVVHDLAAGDVHPIQPRGGQLRKASATLMFDDFPGATESGISAYRRFSASTKERRIFTHPVDGSYFARIGDFKPMQDDSSVIVATCEFLPDAQVHPVSPAGAGTSGTSGESSVAAAADVMSQSLADQGVGFQPDFVKKLDFTKSFDASVALAIDVSVSASFSANVSAVASGTASVSASADASVFAFAGIYAGALAAANVTAVAQASGMASANAFAFASACAALDADARAAVASWTDENVSTRKILIDTARLSDSIATMIEVGGFENDLQLWPAFRAAIMLGESIRSAAIAATSETPSVFVMRVQYRTSLLAVAARTYGGLDAQARARQIAGLNDISTVAWLDPGDYLMPARTGSQLSPLLEDDQI